MKYHESRSSRTCEVCNDVICLIFAKIIGDRPSCEFIEIGVGSYKRKSNVCTLFVEVRSNVKITKVVMATISSSF